MHFSLFLITERFIFNDQFKMKYPFNFSYLFNILKTENKLYMYVMYHNQSVVIVGIFLIKTNFIMISKYYQGLLSESAISSGFLKSTQCLQTYSGAFNKHKLQPAAGNHNWLLCKTDPQQCPCSM